ncbi:MAG TPA: hypothetical protein PKH77_23535 [Anaerolineae bacterium]|nr:hypothetical protein [Anaerolineae bacterium]
MAEMASQRERKCGTDKDMTSLSKGTKRICLPMERDDYDRLIADAGAFRQFLELCFLYVFIKIRERRQHLTAQVTELCQRVWDTYHAPTAAQFIQRYAALRDWAIQTLPSGTGLTAVLKLCAWPPFLCLNSGYTPEHTFLRSTA